MDWPLAIVLITAMAAVTLVALAAVMSARPRGPRTPEDRAAAIWEWRTTERHPKAEPPNMRDPRPGQQPGD